MIIVTFRPVDYFLNKLYNYLLLSGIICSMLCVYEVYIGCCMQFCLLSLLYNISLLKFLPQFMYAHLLQMNIWVVQVFSHFEQCCYKHTCISFHENMRIFMLAIFLELEWLYYRISICSALMKTPQKTILYFKERVLGTFVVGFFPSRCTSRTI